MAGAAGRPAEVLREGNGIRVDGAAGDGLTISTYIKFTVEKVVCENLPQLADSFRLAAPLARFGKVGRTATNQKVGSSNPPGRTIYLP
jgi:hypothetical protein